LATFGRVDELQTESEGQTGIVAEWQGKVVELASGPEQLETVEAELNQLGNPRRAYQTAEAEAAKRPQVEVELAQLQIQLQQAHQSKTVIEQELSPFVQLDIELEQVNTILNQTHRTYQTYLEQRAIAELLPQREANAVRIRQSIADLGQQKESVAQKLAEAQIGYDPVDHQAKEAEREATRTECTRLETQLTGYHDLLPQLESKVAALEAIAADLAELRREGERLVRLQEVVEFIRRTIRDAGPEITRRLVRAVSLRADQIFADIMNDHQQELIWDENYGITIRHDGYTRDFQQLSGGEAMAAALAVRLALLQSMSAVDVAFFDEPTANLDPERRANLAEQIARIKGFSQLVVISHDDTFEQDTGHVIHIAKNEQGYSQVV
jgi:exonuclease SbcC